jgi:hypothetical protein
MAKTDTKELAQCLAFAYFAENPNYDKSSKGKDSEHALNFYNLFSGKENVSLYKHKYLSKQFPIEEVKDEFRVKYAEKTNRKTYHPTSKKVYNVAKTSIEKGIFKHPINEYEFLDQNDAFVMFVKNKCLDKIKTALSLPYRIDALSSVDVFFVRKSKKRQIEEHFKKYISDPETIIHNTIFGEGGLNSYSNIIKTYFDSGDLIPISLKLPTTISAKPNVKRIEMNYDKKISNDIDPFIKFLSAILDEPEKTKEYINKVIHIDFDNFSMFQTLNWKFPIEFRYKELIDPKTRKPLEDYNLDFNLFAQGHSAGWNGQFNRSTKIHKDTQWVGGISILTFEKFASNYSKYKTFASEVVEIRKESFDEVCLEMQKININVYKKLDVLRKKALSAVLKKQILYTEALNRDILNFFEKFKSEINNNTKDFFVEYQLKVIDRIRGFSKGYSSSIKGGKDKRIYAHYSHAQLSHFLIRGGKNYELYFKQQLFISLFGIITKMSHIFFDTEDYDKMKKIVREIIKKEGKKSIISEFETAPHYLIS